MKAIAFALMATLFSPPAALASYFESCEVEAEVLGPKKEKELRIKVLAFKMMDGHGDIHCKAKLGKELNIELEKGSAKPGKVTLLYHYSDGLSPDGIMVSEKWQLK